MMCICFTAWWGLFRNKLLRYYCLYYFLNRRTLKSPRYYWRLFCKGLLRAGDSNGWAHSRCSYCILFRPWGYGSLVGCFYGFISTFVGSMAAAFGGPVCAGLLVVPCGYGGVAVAGSCDGGWLLCLRLCGPPGGLVARGDWELFLFPLLLHPILKFY